MNTSPNYKPSEGKREEFRKYLEKTGVMDALTKVLVSLYEEQDKPEDALTYIQNKLAIQCGSETIESLKAQIETANTKIQELEKENAVLKGVEVGDGEEPPPPEPEQMMNEEEPPQQPPPPPPEEGESAPPPPPEPEPEQAEVNPT